MPRRPRLAVAGLPLHVIQRGNNHGACFFAECDRSFYLHHLEILARRFACAVHAYVLMTNHVHLLLSPRAADSASLLMKHLAQRYSQYVNRCQRRTGTLWEARFRSSLVQSERYFLCCSRYIELNPVRAGMVACPAHYRWSSFRANAQGAPDAIVTPHAEYLALGVDPLARAARYAVLFDSSTDVGEVETIRRALNSGFALGSAEFRRCMEAKTGRRTACGVPGRPIAETLDQENVV